MEKLLIDIDELAEVLGISLSSLYSSYHKLGIPYVKKKGLGLKFPTQEVQLWIKNNIQYSNKQEVSRTKWQKTKNKKAVSTSKKAVISTQWTSHTTKVESESLLEQAMKERRISNSKNS